MRHWQTGEPMVLEWLLAGHGWQDPSPERGLKVPWAQAEREKVFIKNMQLHKVQSRVGRQRGRSSDTEPLRRPALQTRGPILC